MSGFSIRRRSVCRKRAPVAPSTARWSQLIVMRTRVRTASSPSITTGTSPTAPTAKIATSGGLMLAVMMTDAVAHPVRVHFGMLAERSGDRLEQNVVVGDLELIAECDHARAQ